MNVFDKLKEKWSELIAPPLDEFLAADVIKYLCDHICLSEAVIDEQGKEKYIRAILKHANEWDDSQIDTIISLAR